MPVGSCRVANALTSMHSFMDAYTSSHTLGRCGVMGAVPNTDPITWTLDTFLPPLPHRFGPNPQPWRYHEEPIETEQQTEGR